MLSCGIVTALLPSFQDKCSPLFMYNVMTEVTVLLIIAIIDLFRFEKCLQTGLFKKPVEVKHKQPSNSLLFLLSEQLQLSKIVCLLASYTAVLICNCHI